MKHTCPRCKAPGIAGVAKRWSSRAVPARCEACGGLSHVLASTSNGIWMTGIVIVVLSLIAALGWHSPLFFFGGLVLAVACNLWAWKRARLWPISKESADKAATGNWLIAGIAVLLGLS